MEATVAALAESARAGEITAFEKLVKLFMRRAYFFCLGLSGDREDALDISQNAFVRAWRGIGTLRSGEAFPAWFYSILRHEAINFRKSRDRRRAEAIDDPRVFIRIEELQVDEAELSDLRREVWEAVGSLPVEMREIIVMQHFQGMNYDEISTLLGIPRGSVASRLFRAREALKKKFGRKL